MPELIPNVSAFQIGPQTDAGRKRADKLRELQRAGVIPAWWAGRASLALDQDVPPRDVRATLHGAWCRVWDRPDHDEAAAEDWDTQTAHAEHVDSIRQEREDRSAEAQRQRETEDQARRADEAVALKADLRSKYLSLPGTTPEEFEEAYPHLLQDHRRRELDRIERDGDAARQSMRKSVRSGMGGAG